MDGFNDDDRVRLIEMAQRVQALERGQRVSLRRIRKLPDLTATAIVAAVLRSKALLWIGIGITLGSALGGSGIELVRSLIPLISKAVP